MAFTLGNFNIDEILYGVAEDFDGKIQYTLDQLSAASIEISSESTDITDKNGNIVRTIYKSKTGTFSATNAFLHPQVMNAASGASIVNATTAAPIVDMPAIKLVAPGATVSIDDGATNVQVIGIYGSGANSAPLTVATSGVASFNVETGAGTAVHDANADTIVVPASATDAPTTYLVKYTRSAEVGMKLINKADEFPSTVQLTLYCSYVDPCDDDLRACYVVLPSLQWSPETTISLSADDQEMDLSGSIQIDYCSTEKALYFIYFPDENAVKTAVTA